jgi:hypothetical protein
MSPADAWKIVLVFGPILGLLVLGCWVTIRSGVVELASWRGLRRMAQNVSHMAIWTALCMAGLAAVQQLVGIRMAMLW